MNMLWTTCLLMALGAQPVETSPTPTTRLYVRTVPPGARVVLDGNELGMTDGLFLVPPGMAKLSITLDGQQPEIRQIEISEGRITRIEVDLKQLDSSRDTAPNPPTDQSQAAAEPFGGMRDGVVGDGGFGPGGDESVIDLTHGRTDRPPTPTEPPSEIEKTLDSKIELQFSETPLKDVAAFLSEQCNVNVSLDKNALEDMGLGAATPVTFKASGIPLRSALSLLLRDMGLVWTVRGKVLEITSAEALYGRLLARVYAVSDLTGNSAGLGDLIRAVLEPQSWDELGGPGSIVSDRAQGKESLVVRQTEPVHRRVAAFLADLRTVAQQPVDKLPVAVSHEGWWRQTPETESVRKALEQKLNCEFEELPLTEVVRFLQEKTQVPVFLDRQGLAEVGVATDSPLTVAYKDVVLHEVLAMALKNVELTYTVAHDALVVTSAYYAENDITWAIYPVSDLIVAGRTADELVNMLTTTVAPESWDTVGGAGTVQGLRGVTNALVISQSADVHRQIATLLAQLRGPTKSN